jgi:hypothetical protein
MWTARWGHAFAVVNQTSAYRNDMTAEENSMRARKSVSFMVSIKENW